MRVVGHLALIAVERGRIAAQAGDLAGAQARYEELAADLAAIPAPPPGPAKLLRDRMLALAQDQGALLAALQAGQPAPLAGGIAGARARYLALARMPAPDPAALRAVQAELLPALGARSDLDLDAFADFKDRHALRQRLWSAWAEDLDPIGDPGSWGYWEGPALARSALGLGVAAGLLGEDWTGRLPAGLSPAPTGPPETWPAQLARKLDRAADPPGFDAEELGWLPTGDSLIDVGAGPGPRAIGELERLGLDDPDHRARLDALALVLNEALIGNPDQVIPLLDAYVAEVDALGHGSRYYNIKQARNAAIRQLARAGRADLALQVLRQSWPLHHQDWACPNREAILRTVEGRLLAEAGQRAAAEATLAGPARSRCASWPSPRPPRPRRPARSPARAPRGSRRADPLSAPTRTGPHRRSATTAGPRPPSTRPPPRGRPRARPPPSGSPACAGAGPPAAGPDRRRPTGSLPPQRGRHRLISWGPGRDTAVGSRPAVHQLAAAGCVPARCRGRPRARPARPHPPAGDQGLRGRSRPGSRRRAGGCPAGSRSRRPAARSPGP